MNRVRPFLWAMTLFAGLSMWGASPANADLLVTLEGVTFGDGGTASGYFTLDVYGYVTSADIITSSGTSLASAPLSGYEYGPPGYVPSGPAPFDSVFYFNSTADAFSLILLAANPVTDGGFDSLIAGPGSGGSLSVSNEYCTENATACGGVGFDDGRLVTAGTLYAPEPATITLLAAATLLLSVIRRRSAAAIGRTT